MHFFKCRARWNISQEKVTICNNWFNSKEVATTDYEKDSEAAKNLEAKPVHLLEATIKKIKLKYLKWDLMSCRLLKIRKKAELQDRLIYAIKEKVPIAGFVDNTENKDGRPKDGRPKDARPKKNQPTVKKRIPKDSTLENIDTSSDNGGYAN